MLSFHIIVLGKLKETYWREAEGEYLKRLQSFAKVEIHELREESFGEKDKPEVIKKIESEKILKEIKKLSRLSGIPQAAGGNCYLFVLDEHGQQFSSTELSKHINNEAMKQCSNFVFIIGGPLGLDKTILDTANKVFSLSKLTFTHQMARVFLLEQLYRAMMIQNNRHYHY